MTGTTRTRRTIGPEEAAALALPLERGSKRAHVARALGRLLDERPGNDPPISVIARRCRRHRMEVALTIEKLIAEGHVHRLHHGDKKRREHSVYSINGSKTTTHTKENSTTMTTTKATTKPPETASAPTPPAWQREGFWPTLVRVPWPELASAAEAHDAAATALADARAAGDADAERTALLALADGLITADGELRRTFEEAQAAFRTEAATVTPYKAGDRVPDADLASHRASLASAREWVEADRDTLGRIATLLEENTFLGDVMRKPTMADDLAPAVSEVAARAMVLKRELSS